MRRAGRLAGCARAGALALVPCAALAQGAPLDVSDPTPRSVRVQVEDSSNLAVVGQSFGTPFPAGYSASGGVGTLTISAATHELMRTQGGGLPAVPGTFTPIVIQIDLATRGATSQAASGQMASGGQSFSFTQNALGTATPGGFAGPGVPPIFCSSQAQLDQLCLSIPAFCGKTCTLVPGSAYDPASGRVNLVGSETQSGCDGFCQGPFDFFTPRGDLRLTEAPPPAVPALSAPTAAALAAVLAALARTRLARRGTRA